MNAKHLTNPVTLTIELDELGGCATSSRRKACTLRSTTRKSRGSTLTSLSKSRKKCSARSTTG